NPVGDKGDAIRLWHVGERRKGESLLRRQRCLEGDRAQQQAAIELRQHHVHRQVGGSEAARALAPGGTLGGRNRRLEQRSIVVVERRRLAVSAGREGGRGDDDGRVEACQRGANELRRSGVLQADDHQRRRRQAARRERVGQRIDRRGI